MIFVIILVNTSHSDCRRILKYFVFIHADSKTGTAKKIQLVLFANGNIKLISLIPLRALLDCIILKMKEINAFPKQNGSNLEII